MYIQREKTICESVLLALSYAQNVITRATQHDAVHYKTPQCLFLVTVKSSRNIVFIKKVCFCNT